MSVNLVLRAVLDQIVEHLDPIFAFMKFQQMFHAPLPMTNEEFPGIIDVGVWFMMGKHDQKER